jgi:hypothetical protein
MTRNMEEGVTIAAAMVANRPTMKHMTTRMDTLAITVAVLEAAMVVESHPEAGGRWLVRDPDTEILLPLQSKFQGSKLKLYWIFHFPN